MRTTEPDPRDPRSHPNYRHRGPKRWAEVTYPAIAKAAGLTVGTVRQYARRRIFDPADLASVAAFITRHRARRAAR